MSPDTAELAPAEARPEAAHSQEPPRRQSGEMPDVRASDIEPYIGLRYLSKLFRFMAIILVLLLIAEVVTGLLRQGQAAIPTLLGEMSRLIVLAGLLWGAGDLAILLIDVGHDVRASRIMLGRQIAHHLDDHERGQITPTRSATPHRRSGEVTAR